MATRFSWSLTPTIAGACLLAAGEVPNFLKGALPTFPETEQQLRDGEKWAVVPIAVVGVGATMILKSWWPIVTIAATATYYYVGYEKHLHSMSKPEPTNADDNGVSIHTGGVY